MSQIDLLNFVLPAATAVAGYGIREYQNSIKPFVTFDGIVKSGKKFDIIAIPNEIVTTLDKAIFCKGLNEQTRHGKFISIFESCYIVNNAGLENINTIERLLKSSDKTSLIDSLYECFNDILMDRFIMILLVNDIIDLSSYQIPPKQIEFTMEEGKGYFHFPQKGVRFGVALNNPAIIYHVLPFIRIIQSLDEPIIKDIFGKIKLLLQKEYNMVTNVFNSLKTINEKYVKYGFSLNISNLGKQPIAINNYGKVNIKHGKNKYPIDVVLSIVIEDGTSNDYEHPFIIQSGETKLIRWMTKDYILNELNGQEIMNAYKSGNSKFSVSFKIFKVGLIKSLNYSTRDFQFQD